MLVGAFSMIVKSSRAFVQSSSVLSDLGPEEADNRRRMAQQLNRAEYHLR